MTMLGIEMVIAPNFSHFLDVPHPDNLFNRKRQLICVTELAEIGLCTVPHLSAVTPGDWRFWKQYVLLGSNNVGKSAIIDALGLVLGRDRLVRNLGDYDFFGGLPTPKSRIRIVATITGFQPDEPDKHFDWFNAKDGAVPLWWDGTQAHHVADRPKDTQLCAQIAFVARFDEDDLEMESVRYFLDGDGDPFEQDVTTVKQNHLKTAGFFLLPSNRTWDRVVSFGSELFRRVLRFQNAIPAKAITNLRSALRDPTVKLEEDEHMEQLVDRLNSEIDGFIGSDSSGLRFRPTTGDLEGTLQAITPHLPGKADTVLPISKHGSGLISLQTLLLLFEFGRSRHSDGENFILATEEPELHLHPGHHSRLVARIRGTSNQSITTTHSPEIAAYYSPHEVLILRNDDAGARFLRVTDVDNQAAATPALYFVRGYPIDCNADPMTYSTVLCQGDAPTDSEYPLDPTIHLLLDHSRYLQGRGGQECRPPKITGMSGCGIWRLTMKPPSDLAAWTSDERRLVAIQTKCKYGSFMKGTWIRHAFGLIFHRCPELRKVMSSLHIPK